MKITWSILEDNWSDKFSWFLVDEGALQYSFLSKQDAQHFQKYHHLNYMLLSNLNNITHDTMLDPYEIQSWSSKIKKTVIKKIVS